jgi:hypothetical protein
LRRSRCVGLPLARKEPCLLNQAREVRDRLFVDDLQEIFKTWGLSFLQRDYNGTEFRRPGAGVFFLELR